MKYLFVLFFSCAAVLSYSQKTFSGFGKFPVDQASGTVVFDTILSARDPRETVYSKGQEYLETSIHGVKDPIATKDLQSGKLSGEATLGFGYSHLYTVKEKKKTNQLTNAVTGKIHFRFQLTAMDQKARLVIDRITITDTSISPDPVPVTLTAFNTTLQNAASEELADQVEAKNSFARYESMYSVLSAFINGLSEKLMFKPMQ